MHRRYQNTNIPTEILRSVVRISETGSLTKAAAMLGLSQPAISSQIKRIESLVGGRIFQKTPTGSTMTELGKIVLNHARKILEENDQLLRLKGSSQKARSVRLGLINPYAGAILAGHGKEVLDNVSVYADSSREISNGLVSGFVDFGLFLHDSSISVDPKIRILRERDEQLTWVRSRNFVHRPGAPVPLVSWPGRITDDMMIGALEQNDIGYRIAFSTPDYNARIVAVEAGLGLTVLPRSMVPASLVCTDDYYLPALPTPKLLLCAGLRPPASPKLIKALTDDLFVSGEPLVPVA